MLRKYGIRVTFFVPEWVGKAYPNTVRRIAAEGHEIGGHGYMHEDLSKLTYLEEKLVLEMMVERLSVFSSIRGFRAPYWRLSPNTLKIVSSLSILYDSSLMDDEELYVIEVDGRRIVELPVDWRLDDWPYLELYRSLTPGELLGAWIEELESAAKRRGYVSITLHPQCIARGARLSVLEKLVRKALELKAWIPLGRELAEYAAKLSISPRKI